MIRVRTLGQSAIEFRRTTLRPDAEVVFATLLVLCIERGRRVDRETLVNLLWPRESMTKRRHNLRQVLYKLRQLGVDTGNATETLTIAKSQVWIDFEDGNASELADTERGPGSANSVRFMPGFTPKFSKPFGAWLEALRERVEGSIRRRLIERIGEARHAGRWEEVEQLARTCLELDAFNEEATLALAESTALSGGKSKAIAILDAYMAELGPDASDIKLPATVLRRRIASRVQRPLQGPLETKLIGRDDIMESLMAAFGLSKSGRASTHVIWGPSGIGKTRVIEEFATQSALMGARVVSAHASPDDQQTPGLSLVRLLRTMMDSPGALGLAPDVLAFLRQLTAQGTEVASTPSIGFSDDALVRALADLERALAWEQPLVVVFDDLQHADALSRRVMRRANGCLTTERVLFVAASVTDPVEDRAAGAIVRALGRLSEPAMHALAGALIEKAGRSAESDTVDALAAAAGGHPFVLREAVIEWIRDPRAAVMTSLEATIQRRVEALSPEARDVLFTVLVLGEHATIPYVLASITLSDADAERALSELEHEHILRFNDTGEVRTHHLWLHALERLVPVGVSIARRYRTAQVLEGEARRTADAGLFIASADQFQRSGDVVRATDLYARGGVALQERALPSGAYSAFSRAAAAGPSSETFDRCLAQAIIAASSARLTNELAPLLERFGDRIRGSRKLSAAEIAEVEVIAIETRHAVLGDEAIGRECLERLRRADLPQPLTLRLALLGAQTADQDYDIATVENIARIVADLRLSDDSISHHIASQVAMVHAVSTRQIAQARSIAEDDTRLIMNGLAPKDRCRPLLSTRIPFWFDCDFDRVESIVNSARQAQRAYACTFDAIRTEDIYATHCIDTMRLDEASAIIDASSALARSFGYRGLEKNFDELHMRLAIARRDPGIVETISAEIVRGVQGKACARHRTFALCNAAVALARARDTALLPSVVRELTRHWKTILDCCPFDYACVALAIGMCRINDRTIAQRHVDEYHAKFRVATHGPSAFVVSLLGEFELAWA